MDVKKARKLLGKASKDLTDEQIMTEVERLRFFANVIIDKFLKLTPEERAKYAKKKVKK